MSPATAAVFVVSFWQAARPSPSAICQSDSVCIKRIAKALLYVARRPYYRIQPANVRPIPLTASGSLTNPIYVGDIRHKDQIAAGQHDAIIDRQLWDAVQRTLKEQTSPRSRSGNLDSRSVLAGLLFDEMGDRLTPSHAIKNGRRYRYYISQRLMQARKRDASGWRLPAEELESLILASMRALVADHRQLGGIVSVEGKDANAIKTAMDRATNLNHSLAAPLDQQATGVLRTIIARIDIEPGQLTLILSRDGLCRCLGLENLRRHIHALSSSEPATVAICLPFDVRRRGVESRLVIGGEQQRPPSIDLRLIDTIARAMSWMQRLTSGTTKTTAELAREDGIDDGEISRVLPLAFLAPDIVEAIVQGRQPVALTARYLKRLKPLPASWVEQRRILGFKPARSA